MFIGHFSIKKKSNIYGLIFGSRAWRGMQKFLEIAWKLDQACGEADYEMEADTLQAEMDFDEGKTRFKKQIKSGGLKTDKDVFLYCLTNGFLPRVAKDVYRRLHNERLIKNTRDDFPRSSDAAMKQPRQIRI
jgi:hypothetical protein